jgi:capsid protein
MLWNPTRLSPDQIINGFGSGFGSIKDEADARGRDVVTNDGFGQGIVDINRDSIVGSQFRLNAQPNYIVLQNQISKSFDETWAEEFQEAVEEKFNLIADSNANWFDAAGVLTFTGLVRWGKRKALRFVEGLFGINGESLPDIGFGTPIQLKIIIRIPIHGSLLMRQSRGAGAWSSTLRMRFSRRRREVFPAWLLS